MPNSFSRRSISVGLSMLSLGGAGLVSPALADAASTYSSSYSDQWGTVTVKIKVSGKKLKGLTATSTYHTPRSYQLDSYALPTLKSEALAAKSYRIYAVSGATITSDAFATAMKSDFSRAHI